MITFQNRGLLEIRGINTFGVSVKPDSENPIGFFGTGLKYALAVLLREECEVTLYIGLEKLKFHVREEKMRGEAIHMVCLQSLTMPFTTELGKNWELWMAYRELAANAFDEPDNIVTSDEAVSSAPKEGYTTFQVTSKAFDKVHEGRESLFLSSKPKYQLEDVDIHDDVETTGWIYYRGIRVYVLPKQSLYNYNITKKLRLTEDRTVTSISDVYHIIAKGLAKCKHPGLIRQMLLANHNFWESQIDYHWWFVKPGETFVKVVEGFIGGHTGFNTSARSLYHRDKPEEDVPTILQFETIPMEQRRKLWAALMFWQKLGYEIPKGIVHVTDSLQRKKGKALGGHIYISKFVLEMDMNFVTGFVYKLYTQSKPEIDDISYDDLLLYTLVDLGERALGLRRKSA
ncbi:MAG: hypothetical protein V3S69_04230 [Dehalococcoidales bacterium]